MTGITYETTSEDVASRSLRVTVPLEQLAVAEEHAVEEFTRHARLPGFRKGHAPAPVVRRRFEQEIRRHVLEHALRESWDTILKETELKPTSEPQVRNLTFETGQPLTFDLLVEVRPVVKVANTGGFSVKRSVPEVTQEMVDEQLHRLREQKSTWSPLEGVLPKPANLVSVTVTPLEPGKEPDAAQPHELVIGRGQAIPELEERIMALHPGETADAEVKFPDDYPDESRRGVARTVRITLHEVKEQVLPALDDTFAREVGDFESLDRLRTAVQEDLTADAVRTADERVREELIRHVIEANAVPAPHSLVHRLVHALAEQSGIEPSQFPAFEASFAPAAEQQVQRELALEAIAAAQNLHATEADVDARVATLAAARKVDPGKLYAALQQGNRLRDLERTLTEEKTFAWLLSQSTVTEDTA